MDMEQLTELGFDVVAGNIDRRGKNYGVLTKMGPELTPEGKELVEKLMAEKVEPPKRVTRKRRDEPEFKLDLDDDLDV